MRARVVDTLRVWVFRAVDPVVLASVALGLWWLRHGKLPESRELWMPFVLIVTIAPVMLGFFGAYRAMHGEKLARWLTGLIPGLLATGGLMLLLGYLTKTTGEFSRATFLAWAILGPAALVLLRMIAHGIVQAWLRRGGAIERLVVAGPPASAKEFCVYCQDNAWTGLRVVGLAMPEAAPGRFGEGVVVRDLDRVPAMARHLRADRVIVCSPNAGDGLVDQVLARMINTPVVINYAPDHRAVQIFGCRYGELAGRPTFDLSASPLDERAILLKWIEDKVIASLALLLLAPLMVLIAVAIKLTSPGPVLFVQERHGLHGRTFRMFKFRSMHAPDTRHRAGATGDEKPADFKSAKPGDPRITAIGHFLRRTSLDELPQLINVLKGDMSIVGPRPHAVEHNRQFELSIEELMRRHYVKPGITGLAQVRGARGDASDTTRMQRRVELDVEYISNWSIWLDIGIMLRTALRGWTNDQP